MSARTVAESFLAFDFGARRIGVASGHRLTGASPLTTLTQAGDARFVAIAKLVAEWQPDALVVGVPRHPDGQAHEVTAQAERFARQLEGRFARPVFRVDERYSSVEAAREAPSRQGDLDARSAAVILEQHLREVTPHHHHNPTSKGPA